MAKKRRRSYTQGKVRGESSFNRQRRLRDETHARLLDEEFYREAERRAERAGSRSRFVPDPENVRGVVGFGEPGPQGAAPLRGKWISETPDVQEEREELQRKAEFDAATFEKKYTQKQMMDIAKGRRLMGAIDQYPDWDEQEKEAAKEAVFRKYILGTKPTELPATSPFPKGKRVGDIYNEGGAQVSRKANGETWQVDERKTERGVSQEQEYKVTETQAKLQVDLEKEKRSFMKDLYTKEVISKDGLTKRSRTPEEVMGIMREIFDGDQQQDQGELQAAQEFIDNVTSRYNSIDEIPQELQQQFFSAVDLVKASKGQSREEPTRGEMPVVNTDADYEKLKPGTEFVDSKGDKWRKPERKR